MYFVALTILRMALLRAASIPNCDGFGQDALVEIAQYAGVHLFSLRRKKGCSLVDLITVSMCGPFKVLNDLYPKVSEADDLLHCHPLNGDMDMCSLCLFEVHQQPFSLSD